MHSGRLRHVPLQAPSIGLKRGAHSLFDVCARGDDVMGNLTVSKLRAGQVTVGMLAYRCCAGSWEPLH